MSEQSAPATEDDAKIPQRQDAKEDAPPEEASGGGGEDKGKEEGEKGEAKGEDKEAEPGPRAVRFANVTIGVALALAVTQLLFAIQLGRPTALRAVCVVISLALAASFKLRPARRVVAATMLLPAVLLVYAAEARSAIKRPYPGTYMLRRGMPYDTRSLWETITDVRAEGKDAYPSLQPRSLLVLNLNRRAAPEDESQHHMISPEWGVVVDGERVLPLAGVSDKLVVHCNEGGYYSMWKTDEHGFNSPAGLWGREALDVAILGDSFMQAACVNQDENAAHWIRQRYPGTVNLGMAGNGPLIELAGLREFVAPKRPKIVLWVYFNNDMADLDVEKESPVLMRYLEEDGFSQRLGERQAKIDAALVELSGKIEAVAPRWPSSLDSVGLTRKRAPMWLGDLVMRESRSAMTAVVRLDRLSTAAGEVVGTNYFTHPPDLPLFKRVLSKAKGLVEGWGGKMYFVYMADMFYLQYRGKRPHHNRDKVLAAAKEVGLPILDTMPPFETVQDLDTVLFHPESHCSPGGYKFFADVVLRGLEEGK